MMQCQQCHLWYDGIHQCLGYQVIPSAWHGTYTYPSYIDPKIVEKLDKIIEILESLKKG